MLARLVLWTLVFANLFVCCEVVVGASPDDVTALSAALDDLDAWVGDGQNGNQWRRFLRTSELRKQMSQGQTADPAEVARVLQQYRSGAAGLNKRRFVNVRRELQAWLDELRSQFAGDLAKQAWAARGDHVPLTEESFSAVRAELRDAAQQLEKRLGGDSTLAQGWKDYLRWSLLEPHFSDDVRINKQSLLDVERVLRRLHSNKPGLEHPVFVRTAQALERYRESAFWYALGRARDPRPFYEKRLQKLEKQITRNLEKPTIETARQIGQVLGLMQRLGHSPNLVQRVRAEFNQPNALAEISAAAIQRLAQRPVTETQPVCDFILWARVCGTANSTGMLCVKTLPATDHIALELQLAGNIQSRTFSYKKPVRVGSYGSTNFIATKHLQVSDERFQIMPAEASARTKTRTSSVKKTGGKFGRRIIERIARKKVAESKSQAEWISARHAEQRIEDKFNRQVVEAVYQARQNYDSKLRPPLVRVGMFPDQLLMSSTNESLRIETSLASYKQISTNRLPPGVRVDNDFSFRVHETAINNVLPHLLGGAKIKQDSASEPPRVEGDVPAWLKKATQDPRVKENFVAADRDEQSAEFKPWSFLLNSEHPVSVGLDDRKVTIRIRVAELMTLEDGEEAFKYDWDFVVTYGLGQEGNRIVLTREGDIKVFPTDFDPAWFDDPRWDDRLSPKQTALRKNLYENIKKRDAEGGGFPKRIELPPIVLPEMNGVKHTLQLQQLECDDGWLALGYRLP